MKLETIKKDKKKHIIIGSMVVLSVVGCLTLTTTRAKYRNVQSLKLASGKVNYKVSDLQIVAVKVSEDGTNYTEQTEIPTSGYTLNTEKSKCRIPTSTLTGENAPADESIPIEYKEKRVYIGVNQKNTKCYLYFDKIQSQTVDAIIATIEASSNFKTEAPDFTQVATESETEDNNGIYETDDPMYGDGKKTYYWRGAATTNHVMFDSKCWRIVRINGDKSVRLIYNGEIQSGNTCKGNGSWDGNIVLQFVEYNPYSDKSHYVGWTYTNGYQRPSSSNPQTSGTSANLKTKLEDWYSNNISESAKTKVVAGKFCNDRDTQNNETWRATGNPQNYAANQRLSIEPKTPRLSCSIGDIYQLSVGMITADEVQFAGASGEIANISYYLYNGKYNWTMTPRYWGGNAYMFRLEADGSLNHTSTSGIGSIGVRPVINLRSDVTFNAGSDGTQNNPYIVQ